MTKTIGINVPIRELVEVCAKEGVDKNELIKYFRKQSLANEHEIFKYKKYDDCFDKYLAVYNDGKSIIGTFKPSYDNYLNSIVTALGIDFKSLEYDDEELTKRLLDRIEFLRTIPNKAWLHNEFPVLYRNYNHGLHFMKLMEEEKNEEFAKKGKDWYYSCAMAKEFSRFIKRQADSYERFVERRKEYKKLILSKDYNDFIKKNFDKDKLALYLTDKYLRVCEDNMDDKVVLRYYSKLACLFFKYFSCDIDESITVGDRTINYLDIANRYISVKKKIKKIDGKVEWALIPPGKRVKSNNPKKPPTNRKRQDILEMMQKGEEKNRFYDENPPVLRLYGTEKFRGYVANIYENGEILLDKEYDADYPSTGIGDAIYNVTAVHFDLISGLDKTTLRNHPWANKIVHAGAWMDRAKAIITKEGTEEDKAEVKELIKSIEEQNKKNR